MTEPPEGTAPLKDSEPPLEKVNGYRSVFILAKPAQASAPDGKVKVSPSKVAPPKASSITATPLTVPPVSPEPESLEPLSPPLSKPVSSEPESSEAPPEDTTTLDTVTGASRSTTYIISELKVLLPWDGIEIL